MVLYTIQHAACIIRAIIHKFKYHPQEEAVFFVDKDPSSLYCPKIDKITYYLEPDPWDIACHDAESQEEEKRYTEEKISGFFRELNMEPQQFSHIYVVFDLFSPFALYFEMHSIKYMMVEIVEGFFHVQARSGLRDRAEEAYAFNCLSIDMHLFDGRGENCIKVFLASDKSEFEKRPDQTVEIYGFDETILGLDEEHKHMLIKGYNIDQYEFDAVLMFSSQLYTRGALGSSGTVLPEKFIEQYIAEDSYSAVHYFYKVLIDYYFSDIDFIIKLHPESDDEFTKAFSGYKLLPKEIPMQVFVLLDRKFDIITPMGSSALKLFETHNFNVVKFTRYIVPFFSQIHFVFLALTLISAVGIPKKIPVYDINSVQMEYFKNWVYKEFKDVIFEALYVGNVKDAEFILAESSENLSEAIKDVSEDCLIFVNGSYRVDRRIFAKQEMTYSIIDLSEGSEEEIQRLSWTILSKNKALLDSVKDFSASYTLENAKVMIQSSPRT